MPTKHHESDSPYSLKSNANNHVKPPYTKNRCFFTGKLQLKMHFVWESPFDEGLWMAMLQIKLEMFNQNQIITLQILHILP